MKFDFVYLGQTVLKYETPLEIFVGLNEIYEKRKRSIRERTQTSRARRKIIWQGTNGTCS